MVLNISLLEIAFFGDLNVLLSGTHIMRLLHEMPLSYGHMSTRQGATQLAPGRGS